MIPGAYLRHGFGMLLVGVLIFGLYHGFGHYFVEGVGYATIQAILTGRLTMVGLLALLFVCKLAATSAQPGLGLVGRHLLALAVHGRNPGRRLCRADLGRRSGGCRSICRRLRWSAWAPWSAAAPARR